jgi:glycosyltransferase involved in cell wall biosynthesis
MKKTIVIPAYNEEYAIREVIERTKKICSKGDEIIVVDDGSSDRTGGIAKELGVKVLRHRKNRGKAIAFKTAFREVKNDFIVTIDADCTYPPEEIPKLVKSLKENDLVIGSRFRNGIPDNFPFLRGIANVLGAKFASFILSKKVTDVTSGMRAFRKDVVEACDIQAKGLDFEAEFTSRAIAMGFRHKEVPIRYEKRVGRSKLNLLSNTFKFSIAILRGRLR